MFSLKQGAVIQGESEVSWVLAALSLGEGPAESIRSCSRCSLQYSDQNDLCAPFEEDLLLRIQGLTRLHSLGSSNFSGRQCKEII